MIDTAIIYPWVWRPVDMVGGGVRCEVVVFTSSSPATAGRARLVPATDLTGLRVGFGGQVVFTPRLTSSNNHTSP